MQHSKYKDPVNYTIIPNVIFDKWMCILKPCDYLVLLCICRHSLSLDDISNGAQVGDIEKRTSIARITIKKAIKELLKHELIRQCDPNLVIPRPYAFIKQWEINPNLSTYIDLEMILGKKE